jgi:hypothetical protein
MSVADSGWTHPRRAMPSFKHWRVITGLAATFCIACSPNPTGEPSAGVHQDVRPGAVPASPDDMSPDSQFARFLSLSIGTRTARLGMFDAVYTRIGRGPRPGEIEHIFGPCPEEFIESRWLADFRMISVSTRGDSGEAVARITTVARQDEVEARMQIEEDTARWRLIRSPETGHRWQVCGDAKGGFSLFVDTPVVRWRNGGSSDIARGAIDSIRRARGLPLAR